MADQAESGGTRVDDASEAARELTVDEALGIAVYCQQHDQLPQAEMLYRAIMEAAPDRADAIHFAGVLAHQQGRGPDAVALVRRSLELSPQNADWHSNLGIVLQGAGDLDAAVAAYERAVAIDPRHANAHNNRGVLLKAKGEHAAAEAAYRQAIEADPGHVDAYQNLAMLFSITKRVPEAVRYYCKALTLKPGYGDARRLLALAYCVLDQRDKAITLCEEWVAQEPDDPVARHTLAACSGRDVPTRASDAYIVKAFDKFAETFEAKLAQLEYRAPALVAAAVDAAGLVPARGLDVLDAGCGTGLCGPLLASYARRMVGVDLSSKMLEHAREKRVYDELVTGELTSYLERQSAAFDLIVSADTLVYFGALEDVVKAAAGALRPGGLFVFTLEAASWDTVTVPHNIQTHGRYNHREDYVRRVLIDAGLHPEIGHAELRLESGTPVAGLVVQGVKPLVADEAHDEPITGVIGADRA
jgi:predicted TPR repeat methyltransferase